MRHTGELPSGTFGYGRKCEAMLMSGDVDFRPVTRPCWDTEARLADLDAAGVDMQIISATPILFQWQRSGQAALDVARHFNDAALEICDSSGGRLRALCQVPLQDVDAACREVERATETGHVGVHIGNHVGTRDLDDEGLVAFLHHCADIGAPVLVHPWDMDPLSGRTKEYMMGWTVGMPLETHLSITSMVLGGAFDRLPRSLRLCFAHGGGAFPYLLGRLENAWHERALARGKSMLPPSAYLDRFSVDSAVFDTRALRLLVETMGAERVMLGSDYPFPLGEQHIGSLVRDCAALSAHERDQILGGNAVAFFGIEEPVIEETLAAEAERLTIAPAMAAADFWAAAPVAASAASAPRLAMRPLPLHGTRSFPPPTLPLGQQARLRSSRTSMGPLGSTPFGSRGLSRRGLHTDPQATPAHAHRAHVRYSANAAAWFDSLVDDDGCAAEGDSEEGGLPLVCNHIDRARLTARNRATLQLLDPASGPRRGYGTRQPRARFTLMLSRAHQPWARCHPHAHQPWAARGRCLTGELRGMVVASSASDVEAAVVAARRALSPGSAWASASVAERAAVLSTAADLLEQQAGAFAEAESADTGKPLRLARAMDVPRAVSNFRFFAVRSALLARGPTRPRLRAPRQAWTSLAPAPGPASPL